MYIKTTYVGYYTDSGVHAMWCGELPTGIKITVTEERPVLYPDIGYDLQRINTEEIFSAVWLKDGDVQENYIEIEHKEPEPPKEN